MTTEIPPETIWLIILAAAAGTYALRLSFVLLVGRGDGAPPPAQGVLRFVPAAVLAALVVPALVSLSVSPSPHLVYDPAKLAAGGLAALVAWRTEDVLATIGVGMVALWVLQALA